MRTEEAERQFETPDDELLASLRAALQPEPLPPALVRRIRTDLDLRHRVPHFGSRVLHVAALAAACIIVAVLLPRPTSRESVQSDQIALTSDEAAQIVAAFSTLSWDSPADSALNAIDNSLNALGRTLRREVRDEARSPGTSEDDWDLPLDTEDGSSQGWPPAVSRPLAGCNWERDGMRAPARGNHEEV